MTGEGGDAVACHPLMTESIAESSEAMDIIGLNYLTGRHVLEKSIIRIKPYLERKHFRLTL